MIPSVGKFSAGVATRQVSRWEFQLLEDLVFNDPVHGVRVVPADFVSDLASIRILREICRWAAVAAILVSFLLPGWFSTACWLISVIALALYGLVVGYGMRASIMHDWLYTNNLISRAQADAVFYRALTKGDGVARWRAGIFYIGVRIGGAGQYNTKPRADVFG